MLGNIRKDVSGTEMCTMYFVQHSGKAGCLCSGKVRKNGYKFKDDGALTRGLASVTHYLFQPMFLIEGEMNSFVTLA